MIQREFRVCACEIIIGMEHQSVGLGARQPHLNELTAAILKFPEGRGGDDVSAACTYAPMAASSRIYIMPLCM